MPTQKLNIGPVPFEENCAQLGSTPDFDEVARFECRAYCAALIAVYGSPPEGARLRVVGASHDFGTYYEAYVFYDTDVKAAVEYALTVEQGLPPKPSRPSSSTPIRATDAIAGTTRRASRARIYSARY